MKKKIRITLSKLRNRKTPKLDKFKKEMLKYEGCWTLLEKLYTFFKRILMRKKVPEQCRICITLSIYKKGTKDDQKKLGISLLSSISKRFTKIISENIAITG
ncbi:hypothetical protein HN011_000914, partial [Eciton burchellii]